MELHIANNNETMLRDFVWQSFKTTLQEANQKPTRKLKLLTTNSEHANQNHLCSVSVFRFPFTHTLSTTTLLFPVKWQLKIIQKNHFGEKIDGNKLVKHKYKQKASKRLVG